MSSFNLEAQRCLQARIFVGEEEALRSWRMVPRAPSKGRNSKFWLWQIVGNALIDVPGVCECLEVGIRKLV